MQERELSTEMVIKFRSQEDLDKISNIRLDLQLLESFRRESLKVAKPETEPEIKPIIMTIINSENRSKPWEATSVVSKPKTRFEARLETRPETCGVTRVVARPKTRFETRQEATLETRPETWSPVPTLPVAKVSSCTARATVKPLTR